MIDDRVFDALMAEVAAGGRLDAAALARLEASPDLLLLGMLADAVRRRRHEGDATFLRVAPVDLAAPGAPSPAAARELRLGSAPERFAEAVAVVGATRAAAGGRVVAGFAWADVHRYAGAEGTAPLAVLRELRQAGLDALARVPLDDTEDPRAALGALVEAGFPQVRVAVARAPSLALFSALAAFEDETRCVRALNPLPYRLDATRPTTGYHDVRAVALARLAAPNVPTVQVDWAQYGPKLAQVALAFGADDLDAVSSGDDGPEGRRRHPLAEVRRNIEAAGLRPVERDGRFAVVD